MPTASYSYDANDRLSIDTYDNNRNMISSASISNTYDFENRMTAHGSVTLVYDGDGNRVSETAGRVTTKYLADDLNPTGLPQVLDEKVSGSVTRTYAYGLQRISENQLIGGNWTPSFYGYDGHGNVRRLISREQDGYHGQDYQQVKASHCIIFGHDEALQKVMEIMRSKAYYAPDPDSLPGMRHVH